MALDATPLLGSRTGVGAFTAAVTTALAGRDDVNVSAYALSWRGRDQLAAQLPTRVVATSRAAAARPLRAAWSRWDWPPVEWWTGRVDVVHGTNFVVPPARQAAGVVTVHDLTPVRFPELCTADTLAYPALVRRALDRGAWVHTVSRFVAAEVIDAFGADAGRVISVPSGVPPLPPPRPGERPPVDGPYVLTVGTIEPRKDHPSLVAAFDAIADEHADLRLVLVGPDGWGAASLDAALARCAHRDRVVRLGWLDDAARAAAVRGAAVFAFPSVYEGFGFPPLEAMAAGVPVVATAAGALPEVLGDAAALVPVGDVDALAAALARVLDDDDEQARLRSAGHERAGMYSWDVTAAGLVDVYRRAAGR